MYERLMDTFACVYTDLPSSAFSVLRALQRDLTEHLESLLVSIQKSFDPRSLRNQSFIFE
jgi:hypothetical protein